MGTARSIVKSEKDCGTCFSDKKMKREKLFLHFTKANIRCTSTQSPCVNETFKWICSQLRNDIPTIKLVSNNDNPT